MRRAVRRLTARYQPQGVWPPADLTAARARLYVQSMLDEARITADDASDAVAQLDAGVLPFTVVRNVVARAGRRQ